MGRPKPGPSAPRRLCGGTCANSLTAPRRRTPTVGSSLSKTRQWVCSARSAKGAAWTSRSLGRDTTNEKVREGRHRACKPKGATGGAIRPDFVFLPAGSRSASHGANIVGTSPRRFVPAGKPAGDTRSILAVGQRTSPYPATPLGLDPGVLGWPGRTVDDGTRLISKKKRLLAAPDAATPRSVCQGPWSSRWHRRIR